MGLLCAKGNASYGGIKNETGTVGISVQVRWEIGTSSLSDLK